MGVLANTRFLRKVKNEENQKNAKKISSVFWSMDDFWSSLFPDFENLRENP